MSKEISQQDAGQQVILKKLALQAKGKTIIKIVVKCRECLIFYLKSKSNAFALGQVVVNFLNW